LALHDRLQYRAIGAAIGDRPDLTAEHRALTDAATEGRCQRLSAPIQIIDVVLAINSAQR